MLIYRGMKAQTLRKITEPLLYIVLVAAFGFLTAVINHSRNAGPVPETEFVAPTFEQQMAAMIQSEQEELKKVSL